METFRTIPQVSEFVRSVSAEGRSVSLVPTMGALHDGHGSCVRIARELADVLFVSIFVNPTQFGPNEDLDTYPVSADKDLRLCREWGCDAVFMPPREEMYPVEQSVWIDVGAISAPLCGRTRPGHFRGVATVVAKLFNIIGPDTAVFGQKDAQQALVIRDMVRQLSMPVDIRLSPIVREASGLALSSRNRHLAPADRKRAAGIYASLSYGRQQLEAGARDPESICRAVSGKLGDAGITDVEYVELLNAEDLTVVERVAGKVLLAVAARVGGVRLIDNMVFNIGLDGSVEATLLF